MSASPESLASSSYVTAPPDSNLLKYVVIGSLSSLIYGYNAGIIAPAIISIGQVIEISVFELGLIVSIVLLGSMVGSMISGWLSDLLGRKTIMVWNNLFMFSAVIFESVSKTSGNLILARFMLGIGVGVASVVPSLYLTEISPPCRRGRLGAINQLFGWTGSMLSYFAGYLIIKTAWPESAWQIMFASGAVVCLIGMLPVMFFLPESPRWLILHNLHDDCRESLLRIYGQHNKDFVQAEFQRLCDRDNESEPVCFGIKDLINPKHKRPLAVSLALQIIQQLTGNSIVVYYSAMIFYMNGFSHTGAILYSALSTVPQIIVLVIVSLAIDHAGRKSLLLFSLCGLVLCLFALGLLFEIWRSLKVFTWILALLFTAHRVFYSIGAGPIPNILAPEILPSAIRGRGLALAIALNWLFNFAIAMLMPVAAQKVGNSAIYWTLGISTLLGLAFVHEFVFETKRATLEEIEEMKWKKSNQENR